MLKSLLDGILKKVEFQVPNLFKTMIIANTINILLFRGVLHFTDNRQETIEYATGEDLDIKLQLSKSDGNWLVLPKTEVELTKHDRKDQSTKL